MMQSSGKDFDIYPRHKAARMLWVMQSSGNKDFNLSSSQRRGCCWIIQTGGKNFDLSSLSQSGKDAVG